jgi:hypothetical protein
MKKFLLGTTVMIAALFALAAGVQAETGGVEVHISQDFIAGGRVLPAGTYKVYQGSPQTGQSLVLQGQETGASIFLLPSTHDGTGTGQLEVKLTRAGDAYYLSEVSTDLGVYTFTAPQALTQTAKKKNHDMMAASGSN